MDYKNEIKEALNMSNNDPRWKDAQREMDAKNDPPVRKMPLEGFRESENIEDRTHEKPMTWLESVYHDWTAKRDWKTPAYKGGPPRYHPSDIVYDDMRVDESKPVGADTGTGNVMSKEHTVQRPQDAARERRERMKEEELDRFINDRDPRGSKRKS